MSKTNRPAAPQAITTHSSDGYAIEVYSDGLVTDRAGYTLAGIGRRKLPMSEVRAFAAAAPSRSLAEMGALFAAHRRAGSVAARAVAEITRALDNGAIVLAPRVSVGADHPAVGPSGFAVVEIQGSDTKYATPADAAAAFVNVVGAIEARKALRCSMADPIGYDTAPAGRFEEEARTIARGAALSRAFGHRAGITGPLFGPSGVGR